MLRKACPGLLLTFASVFVGLCKFADTTSSLQHPICKPGLEFWSTDHAVCWPCTRCAPNFTLSPCALHKDAICGPLSALELNWSFLSTRRRPEADQHRLGVVTSRVLWRFPTESIKRGHERTHKTASNLVDLVREDDETLNDEKPVFSSRESKTVHDLQERRQPLIDENNHLSWDWQTGALVLAVCTCIVFFLVAGCSALIYARQWRRMKRNFEPATFEEISARLNLMVKAELAELVAGTPMNPDRKWETSVVTAIAGWPVEMSGNLYVEEGSTPKNKQPQIQRNYCVYCDG